MVAETGATLNSFILSSSSVSVALCALIKDAKLRCCFIAIDYETRGTLLEIYFKVVRSPSKKRYKDKTRYLFG